MSPIVVTLSVHINALLLFCSYIVSTFPGMSKKPNSPKRSIKSDMFQFRLTAEEKAGFSEAAEIAGLSLATWMRERLRRIARRELEDADRPVPFLKPNIVE